MSPGNGIPPRDTAEKSLGEIVGEVSEKASLLVREEIELAKAEVTDKVTKLGKGAGIAAAAGVFLVFAVTMFFHFFAWFLNDLFDWNSVWPGFGITALLLFLLAAIAGFIAYRLVPEGRAAHARHGDRAGQADARGARIADDRARSGQADAREGRGGHALDG